MGKKKKGKKETEKPLDDKHRKKEKIKQSSDNGRYVKIITVVGFTFIALATFNFSWKIPNIDKNLEQLMAKVESYKITVLQHDINESLVGNNLLMIKLLKEINPKSVHLSYFHSQLKACNVQTLDMVNELLTGNQADMDLIKKWSTMEHNQLQEEKKKLLKKFGGSQKPISSRKYNVEKIKNRYGLELANSINEIKAKKQDTLFWSILFQIFGLAISQLAVILKE